ncbi:MAG: hypothetical protein PHU42_02715 [Patescibacteria group bacterium]|nr:hypothetical protein [Patescibacteria group bacterium]
MVLNLAVQQREGDDFSRENVNGTGNVSPELYLFMRNFKYLKSKGPVRIEDFGSLSVEASNAGEMSDEEKKKLTDMHVENRSHISEEYTKDIRKTFEGLLNKDNLFYILWFNKKDILAFIRLQKDKREGHKAIGSLNIAEGAKNLGMGSMFFEKVLSIESKNSVLHSNTNPFYDFFKHHIEDYGFNAEEIAPYGDSGEMHVNMTLDKSENEKLVSRHRTKTEIVQDFENGVNMDEYETYSFDLKKEKKEFLDLLKQKLNNEKKLLTRYIHSEEDPEKIYIVIEKKEAKK